MNVHVENAKKTLDSPHRLPSNTIVYSAVKNAEDIGSPERLITKLMDDLISPQTPASGAP